MEKGKDDTKHPQEHECQSENRKDNIKMLLQQVLVLETKLQARDGEVQNLRTQLLEQKRELKERDKQLEGKCRQREKSMQTHRHTRVDTHTHI